MRRGIFITAFTAWGLLLTSQGIKEFLSISDLIAIYRSQIAAVAIVFTLAFIADLLFDPMGWVINRLKVSRKRRLARMSDLRKLRGE